MKVEFWDVVAAQLATQLAEVRRMSKLVERPVYQRRATDGCEPCPSARLRQGNDPFELCGFRIESVPGAGESFETLDHDSFPIGDVSDEYFQDLRCALAATIKDRSRDIHATATAIKLMNQPRPHQIADVWNGPIVAELDELVVPQTVNTAPRGRGLAGENLNDAAQRAGIGSKPVFVFINRGNPLQDLLGIVPLEFIAGWG